MLRATASGKQLSGIGGENVSFLRTFSQRSVGCVAQG